MLHLNQYIIGILITATFSLFTTSQPLQQVAEHPVSLEGNTHKNITAIIPSTNLPSTINIQMPFFAQAPLGNWSLPYAEACEEASALLIANQYFQHNWTASEFSDQIDAMVAWENQTFNKYIDTSANETSQILNQYLGLKTAIHNNPSLDDVKEMLANGHLLIGFFAGKELHNPNYRNNGPNYHAIVIKGYRDNDQIITDDVGTEKGADYIYSWDTIHNALHDLSNPIENGAKLMIEVWPAN